jgi:hypothetical protein
VTNSANNTNDINGNVTVNGGAFNIEESQTLTGGTQGSGNAAITGNYTMSSGTLDFGTPTVLYSGSTTVGNTRLTINGTTNITGGTVAVVPNTNGGSIFLNGTNNTINGVTGLTSVSLTTFGGQNAQNLTTDQVIGQVFQDRNTYNGVNVFTLTDNNTSTSGNIGQFQLYPTIQNPSNTATVGATLVLGNNLTTTANAGPAISAANYGSASAGYTGNLYYTVDLKGYTFDTTNSGTAANVNIFTLNSPTTGNLNHSEQGDWTIESTTGDGMLKAGSFNFSNSGTQYAYNVTIGPNVTLLSTGGTATSGVTNNLSVNPLSSNPGTIDPTSTFLYTGPSVATTPTNLISNRTIGNIAVQNGALNLAQSAMTAGGGVAITNGGSFLLNGSSLGTLTLGSGQGFTMNSGTLYLTLNLTGGSDQILGNNGVASGGTFTIINSTLTLSGNATINYGDSYTVLGDFASGSISGLTINGYDNTDYTANLSNAGVLTFTAVPEPPVWMLLMAGGFILMVWRGRQALV